MYPIFMRSQSYSRLLGVLIAVVIMIFSGNAFAQGKMAVSGKITDAAGEPLPGAAVVVKGTSVGVSSDVDGSYLITFKKQDKPAVLVYSFIGMKSKEVTVSSSTRLDISLEEDNKLDAVVINGFYAQAKETFTGSATTISGEKLTQMSPSNLLAGIASLTPGMVLVENNAAGANPNAIPSILIRGANTLITNSSEEGVNNPIIILDGVKISLEELYDLDIFDIERVDVLKDASATILYGDEGANGVIVVERKKAEGKLQLNYNFVPKYSIPDLSSFNLCNAEQKLELERLSGLYDSTDGSLDKAYAYKLENVRRGINTDWIRQPLRIPFSHNHSLSLSNRSDKLEVRANANFNDSYGVMKGDNRRSFGLNFTLAYHLRDKITLSYNNSFAQTNSVDSPYGSFSKYAQMNPYNPIYDEEGNLITGYYFNPYVTSGNFDANPLYDATLSSFSKSSTMNFKNSLSLRWNITKYFYITSQANLSLSQGSSDKYVSPETADNLKIVDVTKRGSYNWSNRNSTSWDGKVVVNYGKSLDTRGSMFRISGGGTIKKNHAQSKSASAIGFLKDELSDISFALSYPSTGSPAGSDNISTQMSAFANANVGFRNRYFLDLSYNASGSSRFGSENSFAPFWSAGFGWNLHNEAFAKKWDWLDTFTFRYSIGYTGSVSFDYYQAKTVYEYASKYSYYTGIGAVPKQMGNPNLKWQRTLNNNFGITAAALKNRFNLSLDFYSNTTYDMLMSIDLPPSVGTSSMNVNFGELNNKGIDLSLSGQIINKPDFFWSVTVTGGHVMDQIRKISDTLKNTEVSNSSDASAPRILFREGGSQFDIYAMRSAGIDPATGKEIFIKKNGEYTFNYSADERVAVGNTNPILNGSLMTTVRYKRFSLSLSTRYTFGSDYYNTTLQQKVEKIDRYHNVDARAFTERWHSAGDVTRYIGLDSDAVSNYSERFVEKRNELYLSSIQVLYDVKPAFISRFGLKKLVVGVGTSDIGYISTVKFERGTSYPYQRTINLVFRPTF